MTICSLSLKTIFFEYRTTTLLFALFNALQFHFIKLNPIFVGSVLCQYLKQYDFLWTCSVLAWNLTIFELCSWKPFDPTPISTCTYLLCYDSMKKMRSVERNFMFPWVVSKKISNWLDHQSQGGIQKISLISRYNSSMLVVW